MDYVKKALENHNSKTEDNPIGYDECMKSVDWAGCMTAASILEKCSKTTVKTTVESGCFDFQEEVEDDLFNRIAYEIALKELYLYFKDCWQEEAIKNRDQDL